MKKKISLRKCLTDLFKLPEDLVYQEPIITLLGSRQLLVENYQTLLEYQTERIVIRVRQYKLIILGKQLEILNYTSDEMHISGVISSIFYEN